MPNLHIRDVPIDVLVQLKFGAQREGRSLNRHVVALLEEAAAGRKRSLEEVYASIDERARLHPLPPGAPMPEELIREARDSR
jgi:plasmid stability protein